MGHRCREAILEAGLFVLTSICGICEGWWFVVDGHACVLHVEFIRTLTEKWRSQHMKLLDSQGQ